jgi:hypothetical protein
VSHEESRVEHWAKELYEGSKPPSGAPWEAISHGPAADRWRRIARVAYRLHLEELCEQRCKKCGDKQTHWCAHCDRS